MLTLLAYTIGWLLIMFAMLWIYPSACRLSNIVFFVWGTPVSKSDHHVSSKHIYKRCSCGEPGTRKWQWTWPVNQHNEAVQLCWTQQRSQHTTERLIMQEQPMDVGLDYSQSCRLRNVQDQGHLLERVMSVLCYSTLCLWWVLCYVFFVH